MPAASVALKVTSPSQWEAPSHSDGPSTQRDEATNLRLQRLNDVMAAKMRSSSIEPKPATEEGETAGLDLMSLLVNPVARGVLRRRVDGVFEAAPSIRRRCDTTNA